MILTTPEKLRSLWRKLYVKAKAEPDFRFYQLYDKVWREDILHHAYRLARSDKGAPGVDGVSFATIEAAGLENWLSGIRDASFPGQAPQGVVAWHQAFPRYGRVRGARCDPTTSGPSWPTAVCFEVKPVGKPDAGNPHVRFDERGEETE